MRNSRIRRPLIALTTLVVLLAGGLALAPTSAEALVGACFGKAYITGKNSNSLMIVDTIADSVIETVTSGLSSPVGFVISSDGSTGYLANFGANEVLEYDLETMAVTRTFSGLSGPYYMGINPAGTKLAVSERSGSSIAIIDLISSAVTHVALSAAPFQTTMNHVGTKIYVAGSSRIWVIDVATEAIDAEIPTTGSGYGIGVLPDDTKVYVAQGDYGVDVIDTSTNTLTNTTIPNRPYWITVSPDGSTVWSVLYGDTNGSVARIDTATDSVVATVSTPTAPSAYLSGITADGSTLFVFGYDPGTAAVDPLTDTASPAAWTAPGDPWDFQTCGVAVPPTPTTTSTTIAPTTTSGGDPVVPEFTG